MEIEDTYDDLVNFLFHRGMSGDYKLYYQEKFSTFLIINLEMREDTFILKYSILFLQI